MKFRSVCGLLMGMVLALAANADIYRYIDGYGRVYLTDRPNHGGYKLLVKTWKGWTEAAPFKYFERNQKKYSPAISDIAERYRLPKALLHAVIATESSYNPNAVSHAGAVGLMQLMPETGMRYGVVNRRDPVANMHGGTRYLRDLLVMFDNDLVLALAAYNAGENAVKKYGNKVPPYKETQHYVRKVLNYYKKYRSEFGSA
jgi:soluble lytic murein transglycosylase-like protein